MPDYIYLLENRLSAVQQSALRTVRDLAREAQMIVFLTGDAVRDLTCGNPVRDLEVIVHGNPFDLKSVLLSAGGKLWGEDAASRTLYLCFPGSVRLDLGSARKVEYPKPGQPVYTWATIQEELRARDFTVNAMAISLNEGSYGLLMDPTNGVADIEARVLRLVSNYGFLDNPVRMVAAARLKARLGFDLEERTETRYENARGEEVIEHLSDHDRGRELEQIGHEDEPLKVMAALEAQGWMTHLFAPWTAAKADTDKLAALHDLSIELQVQGVHPDVSAGQMQLLTAKLAQKDLASLKKLLLRPGFVAEWDQLDAHAAEFAKVLLSKENATPSATYNLFTSYAPEAILWLGFTSKQAAVKEKFENFLKVWPQARQKIPYAMMLEMRITPELPGYAELVKSIFLQLIDGGLTSNDEIKGLLEPYSPPAPPPPVTIKRTRAKKGDAKAKAALDDDEDSDDLDSDGEDDDDEIDGMDMDGEELDFSIGADDARSPQPSADGDDDDVFARVSVGGDDDLDLDASADSEEEESDGDSDSDDDDPPPRSPKGGKSAAKGAAKAPAKPAGKAAAKGGAKKSPKAEAVAVEDETKVRPAARTHKSGFTVHSSKPAKAAPAAPVKIVAKPARPAAPLAVTSKSKPAKSEHAPARAGHVAHKSAAKLGKKR